MTDDDKKLFEKGIHSVGRSQHAYGFGDVGKSPNLKHAKQSQHAMYNYLRKLGMNEIDAKRRVEDIFNVIKESANIGEDTIRPQLFDRVTSQNPDRHRQHEHKFKPQHEQFTLNTSLDNSTTSICSGIYVDVNYNHNCGNQKQTSERNSQNQFDYNYRYSNNINIDNINNHDHGNKHDHESKVIDIKDDSTKTNNINNIKEKQDEKESGFASTTTNVRDVNGSINGTTDPIVVDNHDKSADILNSSSTLDEFDNGIQCKCCVIM